MTPFPFAIHEIFATLQNVVCKTTFHYKHPYATPTDEWVAVLEQELPTPPEHLNSKWTRDQPMLANSELDFTNVNIPDWLIFLKGVHIRKVIWTWPLIYFCHMLWGPHRIIAAGFNQHGKISVLTRRRDFHNNHHNKFTYCFKYKNAMRYNEL